MRIRQGGYATLVMLFLIALFALGLARVGEATRNASERQREEALVEAGAQWVRAIRSYYRAHGSFPKDVQSLVADRTAVPARRHLRRVPLDPVTNSRAWSEIRDAQGNLVGASSTSERKPWRSVPVYIEGTVLPAARKYSDWHFVYSPPLIAP